MIVTGRDFAELTADIDHFEAEFLALAVRTMRQVAERSGHVRVAAASEEPGEPFFSLDDLAMIATFWAAGVPELAALLLAVWRASAGALRASIGRQRADQGLPETTGDDDLDLRLAEEYLASAQNRMVRFADVLWEVAREQLLEGFAGGESIGELRDRLMDVPGLTAARATRVARTEVVSASNAGSLSLVLEMGFTGTKTWLATEDARTRHTHAEAEGQTVDLRASFEVGTSALFFPGDPSGAPEEIINCVPGSSEVGWPGQSIRAVTRRSYSGPLFKFGTADGHELTITPNHPVLTRRGYVPAQFLCPGDEVFTTGTIGSPEIADMPARADQLYRALSQTGVLERVMGSAVDFHQDGSEAEVSIVRADRGLPVEENRSVLSDRPEQVFVGLDEAPGTRSGSSGADVLGFHIAREAGFGTSSSLMSRARQSAALLRRKTGHADPVRFASASEDQTQFLETFHDSASADAEAERHAKHAVSLGMSISEIVWIDVEPLNHLDVYNLSTSAEWYTANGITVHNCRCDMTYDLEDEMADEELTASAEAATAALSPAESAPVYVITLPELPDPGWFTEPELEDLDGPVTLTDQGRFYGWLAPPGAKHRSFSQDVGVPSGNVDYSKFMSRETITADGSRVRCGVVTMDCGHAPLTPEFDATASAEHYDNTCSIAANVVIGEKVTPKGVGTWVAGAALPGLSAGQFLRILSSAMSGDWRPSKERRGWYEFVAALLVPVPGFATERHAVTASAAEEGGITCTVPITYAESECAPCTASAPQEEPVTDFSSEVREVLRMVHPEIAAEAAALHASIMDT